MLPKSFLLVLLASFIEADIRYPSHSSSRSSQQCQIPKLDNGRVYKRGRARMIKFSCFSRYELVGNRYSTCKNGQWDVPVPVCVRAGCDILPMDPNSIQVSEHQDAWIVTFCLPKHKLVGSSAVYCDGKKWNDTAPKCVDESAVEASVETNLSCDFETPDICGWTQDELHDFDWRRWNQRTPSYFIFTGPSYDHTYGEHRLGYYMYIESSTKNENETARLLSPVYDMSLTTNSCFSFYYHMFGTAIGGLRVFQKPNSVQLHDLLNPVDQNYLLFEMWNNQGDFWFRAVPQLKTMNEDFQIVIEGVCGDGYTSDIAIDDVAILKGNECDAARMTATTPTIANSQSCVGRCFERKINPIQCDCTADCVLFRSCCRDFLDVCLDLPASDSGDYEATSTESLPETQKLVGESTTPKPTTAWIPTAATTTTAATFKPTQKLTTSTTPKPKPWTETIPTNATQPTRSSPVTWPKTWPTSIPVKPTTPKTPATPTIPKISTTFSTTRKISTTFSTTQKISTTFATTRKIPTTLGVETTVATLTDASEIEKSKHEAEVNLNKMATNAPHTDNKSSSWKSAVVCMVVVALCASLAVLVLQARSARGRAVIARLRGSTRSNDSEVRYLTSADDDDL